MVGARTIAGAVAFLLTILSLGGTARAAGEFEPNDARESAFGPLAGGTSYTGTFETVNDVDWYVFYLKAYSQMDFSATMLKVQQIQPTGSTCNALIRITDKDGKGLETGSLVEGNGFSAGNVNETRHLQITMDPGRYYFEVNRYHGCATGDAYRLLIEPASAVTTSRDCGEAIVARDSVRPLLSAVGEALVKNGERLVTKASAVHEAKEELRRSSRKAKRVEAKIQRLTKLHVRTAALRSKLRALRRQVQRAQGELADAKAERSPVWKEKVHLEALAHQYEGEIAAAEGKIGASC